MSSRQASSAITERGNSVITEPVPAPSAHQLTRGTYLSDRYQS